MLCGNDSIPQNNPQIQTECEKDSMGYCQSRMTMLSSSNHSTLFVTMEHSIDKLKTMTMA